METERYMENDIPQAAPSPLVKKVHIFISDAHLSQGLQPDGEWHKVEDFRSDREFAGMLDLLDHEHPQEVVIVLHFNGDIFDFMGMPVEGSYLAVPTVEASLGQFRAIMTGHPVFFDAVRRFMAKRPDAELIHTIGNHDQDLAWPELQEAVRAAYVPSGQAPRVRFVRQSSIGPADVLHGCEFDPLNDIPSEEGMFITDKKGGSILPIAFMTVLLTHGAILPLITHPSELLSPRNLALGVVEFLAAMVIIGWAWGKLYFSKWGKTQRFMNYPLPYYIHARLYMTLKRLFLPDMGRVQDHGSVWIKTLARSPYWAPVMVAYLVGDVLLHMFFIDIWSVRRKASLGIYARLLAMSMSPDKIDQELDRYAKEHPDVKYVIAGHTHAFGVRNVNVGERTMVYMNTGTWVEQRDLVLPQVRTVTSHPRLEAFFRRIPIYLRRAPLAAIAIGLVHLAFALSPAVIERLTGWSFGVTEYLFPPLSLFLLLWRFSFTEYKSLPFTKRTVAQLDEYENGDIQLMLNEYLAPAEDEKGYGKFVNAL
jgi:UDP-2,3-diacylglucosamine pyrophosphatase LpxH